MMDKQYRCSLSRLLFSYWKGEEKKRAWGMAITIAALTVAAVYMTLLLNDWFNSFYSALQNYDQQAIYHGLIQFTGYAFAYIAFAVYADYLQQRLALRWRCWMTENIWPSGQPVICTIAWRPFPVAGGITRISEFRRILIRLRPSH